MSGEGEEINIVSLFEQGGFKIRTVVENGETLYCAKDICKSLCLGESAHKKKIRALDPDETMGCRLSTPLRGTQTLTFVTEPGLYKMILWSKGAKTQGHPAHQFVRWIVHDVLPQIRQNLGQRLAEKDTQLTQATTDNTFLRNNRLYHIAWSILANNPRNYYQVKNLMSDPHTENMLRWEHNTPYVKPEYIQTVRNFIQNLVPS
jgi:prophage antirepressor-like protein